MSARNSIFINNDEPDKDVYETLEAPPRKPIILWHFFLVMMLGGIFILLTQVPVSTTDKFPFQLSWKDGDTVRMASQQNLLMRTQDAQQLVAGKEVRLYFESLADTVTCDARIINISHINKEYTYVLVRFSQAEMYPAIRKSGGRLMTESTAISLLNYIKKQIAR